MAYVISGKTKDLGDGFHVVRILPHIDARAVGPFVFVDHFGPAPITTGHELSVRPHPHIGLATVTYLYDGVIFHKDSIGSEELIQPDEVNWMTAGRGIVHSEHSRRDARYAIIEGIQTWVALPAEHEETEPAFEHYAADVLPVLKGPGWKMRLIAGSLMSETSPVKILSPLFYADLELTAGGSALLDFPPGQQAALYVARGAVAAAGQNAKVGEMIVFADGEKVTVAAPAEARVVLLGGKRLAEPRHLWWNFVSSSKERIEKAKLDWQANTMGLVAGESDRIPLPE
ncbi:MAG: pirin family protein [Spirochaetes bacterium]|nr:pirin family protein [Spirochaetota bacterium]